MQRYKYFLIFGAFNIKNEDNNFYPGTSCDKSIALAA